MPSFRKSAILAFGAALGISQVIAQTGAKTEGAPGKAPAKPAKTSPADKTSPEDKNSPDDADGEERDPFRNIPVPDGQPQKEVNVPSRRPDGRMAMNFQIGVLTKIDEEKLKLGQLRVQTYQDDGKTVDLDMDLPDAIYNRKTKILTSEVPVKVKSATYEIVGQNMSFHVDDHTGAFGGGVKMIIYDSSSMGPSKDKKTTVEFGKPVIKPHTPAAPPAPATPPQKNP